MLGDWEQPKEEVRFVRALDRQPLDLLGQSATKMIVLAETSELESREGR